MRIVRRERTMARALKQVFCVLFASLGLLGCGGSATEGSGPQTPAPDVVVPGAVPGVVAGSPGEGSSDTAPPPPPNAPSNFGNGPNLSCKLPAPVKSEDACSKDADCAPSVPCHARACVAAEKAQPRTPDMVCTTIADCQSADTNRCSCYEGRCALVPPGP